MDSAFFLQACGNDSAEDCMTVRQRTTEEGPMKREKRQSPVGYSLALCVLLLTGTVTRAQSTGPSPVAGARQYQEYCAACHGADGKGGDKAASLATSESVRDRTEAELFRIVHDGTPEGMPPFAQIGDANIAAVVHYLRVVADSAPPPETASTPVPVGDPNAGRALYFGKAQCSACHMVNGQGGFEAASLTAYARNRTAEMVRQAITAPGEEKAPIVHFASAVTRDGRNLTGVVRNEDAFTLTLQTQDGRFHFLEQKDLTAVRDAGHLLMPPDYGTLLTAKELNDVVSFLMVSSKARDNETEPAR